MVTVFDGRKYGLSASLLLMASHGAITLLAVAIAFALPTAAKFILYQWWPRVEADPNLLLATEIGLASALVLLFNGARIAWGNRAWVRMANLAALVYARHAGRMGIARWRERALVKRLPLARDAFVLSLTGYDTFVDKNSLLREVLEKAYEVRVLLLNPLGEGLRRRVDGLPAEVTVLSFHGEIEASINYLAELRKRGKAVSLRFYEQEPFWKVIVLGDHVWVQHCHDGVPVRDQPEYVFALQHRDPRRGLFVPFYMHFLSKWNEHQHPEYDFDTGELVYRDSAGNETRRKPLGVPISGVGTGRSVFAPAPESAPAMPVAAEGAELQRLQTIDAE